MLTASMGNEAKRMDRQASHALIVDTDVQLLRIFIQREGIILLHLLSARFLQIPLNDLGYVIPNLHDIIGRSI